jgi:hypothetical protein
LPKPAADSPLCDAESATLRLASSLSSAPKSNKGEEAATPGNQSRSARFWKFPPAIHSRESPVTAGSAAIIRPSQELSRFAEHTFRQIVAARNTKSARHCAETVDVETSLWKP